MSDNATFTCFSLGDLKRIAKHYNREFIDNRKDKIQYAKRSKGELWRQLFDTTLENSEYYFPLDRAELFKGRHNRITNEDILFFFTHVERIVGVDKFKFYGAFHHEELQNIQQTFQLSESDCTAVIVRDHKKQSLLTLLTINRTSKRIAFFDPRGYNPCGQMARLMKIIASVDGKHFKEKISREQIGKSAEFNIEAINFLLKQFFQD